MTECVGLMIAKRESTRLPGKNTLDFMGAPLFEWNLNKILSTGIKVYFDSDSEELLLKSEKLGAIPHLRPARLLGHDIPSVPIFQQLYDDFSIFSASLLNIQANSPNVSINLIDTSDTIIQKNPDKTPISSNFDGGREKNIIIKQEKEKKVI